MDALAEPVAALTADPMVPRFVRVRKRTRDLPSTVTLELESADGEPLPAYRPGQFTMLYVIGVGEIPISISGDASDRRRLVQTIRSVGAVSEAVTRLKIGDLVGLRGPEEILYRRQLETWRKRLDLQIEVTVDHAGSDWRGNVGVVTRLIPRLAIDMQHATALVCGPEVMMRFAAAGLHDVGLPESAIFVSLERNMKCAVGLCGHCQFAGMFACKDGAVVRYDRVRRLMGMKEI